MIIRPQKYYYDEPKNILYKVNPVDLSNDRDETNGTFCLSAGIEIFYNNHLQESGIQHRSTMLSNIPYDKSQYSHEKALEHFDAEIKIFMNAPTEISEEEFNMKCPQLEDAIL